MDVIRKGNSRVFIQGTGIDVVEQERSFRDSYYRVIEIANQYIKDGFRIYKFNGSQIHLIKGSEKVFPSIAVLIGHSNGVDMKGNSYVNREG